MKLVGFNFKKLSAERISNSFSNLKINTNIDILEVEKLKSNPLKGKEEILSIGFQYRVNYSPEVARVELEGTAVISIEAKQTKSILKDWQEKKVSPDFKIAILNLIFRKSNIKALELEEELNLPLHLPFPVLKKEEKETN